jgi:hypothetical protein
MSWLMVIARDRPATSARRMLGRPDASEVPVTFSDEAANVENEECRDPQALKRPDGKPLPGQRDASGSERLALIPC